MNGVFFPNGTYNDDLIRNNDKEIVLENILNFNKGKRIKANFSFPNLNDTQSFEGILENIGIDYLIISDPTSGKWRIIKLNYLNYIEVDEVINT